MSCKNKFARAEPTTITLHPTAETSLFSGSSADLSSLHMKPLSSAVMLRVTTDCPDLASERVLLLQFIRLAVMRIVTAKSALQIYSWKGLSLTNAKPSVLLPSVFGFAAKVVLAATLFAQVGLFVVF